MIINPIVHIPKSWLEEKTYKLLQDLEIQSPDQINLESIATNLNVDLLYSNTRSYSTLHPTQNGWSQIYVDYSIAEREQREIIAHELGHILHHSGNQLFMSREFIQLQESQTDRFAGYLLVPFYMIDELPDYQDQAIYYIAETFNVTLQLARTKYNQLISRQYEYRYKFIV